MQAAAFAGSGCSWRWLKTTLLDAQQKFVVQRVATGSDLAVINYQYGTDRKYVAGLIGQAYQEKGYVVEAVALSGMGARNFEKGSGIAATTIFKKLWEWDKGQNRLNAKSVLMVDHANLVGTRQMLQILKHADDANAKLILLGEGQSLQPIAAGGAYRGIQEYGSGTVVTLARDDRQADWRQQAQDGLLGDERAAKAAIDLYAEHGAIERSDDPAAAVVENWLAGVERTKSYQGNLMIAYRNDDVQVLNLAARDRLKDLGYVDGSQPAQIRTHEKGVLEFAGGDRILFLRNDEEMGIKNGTLGTVRSVAEDQLVVKIDGGEIVSVDTRLYNDLNYGYAISVHKSAGLAVDNTYIWATAHYHKHALQAALAVHTQQAKIYHQFDRYGQLKERLSRAEDKVLATDYPMDAKAYKITFQFGDRGWPYQKYVLIDPQTDKAHEKQELNRQAKAFAEQQALRLRLQPEELKAIGLKVEQISLETYREMQKAKDIPLDRGMER